MDQKIAFLIDAPAYIDEVAVLWQQEWSSDKTAAGLEKQKRSISKMLNRDSLPLLLVAIGQPGLIGTIALFDNDLESRPDLTPWLGGVLVKSEYRGQGFARALVDRAVREAVRLGHQTLYLHTESAGGLYKKLGWQKLGDCTNDSGENSEIFSLQL